MKSLVTLSTAAALLVTPAASVAFQRGSWPTDGVIVRQPEVPQMQPLPAGTGTLFGRVVDGGTMTPLAGATVVVRLLGARVGPTNLAVTPFGRVLTADKSGVFVVPQVAFGTYVVEVTMDGFADGTGIVPGGSRRMMVVSDTQPSATEAFPLSRLGTIDGTVVDESGKPVADQAVMLFRKSIGLGEMTLPEPSKAITDSAGRYRFTNVPPNEYIAGVDFRATTMPVSVSEAYRRALQTAEGERMVARFTDSQAPVLRPLPPGLSLTVGAFQYFLEDGARRLRRVDSSPDGKIMGVAATYAPGVTSFTEAGIYPLAPGQNLSGIDIKIRRQPTVRVCGSLAGPEGSTSYVGLRLVPKGSDNIDRASFGDAAATVTDERGQFSFLGVLPGQYTLEGFVLVYPSGGQPRPGSSIPVGPDGLALRREVQRWAKLPITVSTENIADLAVELNAPFLVTGTVVFVMAGDSGPPRPVQAGIRVYLLRRTGQQASSPSSSTTATGTFSLGPVYPDKYSLGVSVVPPWSVLSVVANGRDITNQVIDLDRDLKGIVITLTNAGR